MVYGNKCFTENNHTCMNQKPMKTIITRTFEWSYGTWAQLTFLDLELFKSDVVVKFTLIYSAFS